MVRRWCIWETSTHMQTTSRPTARKPSATLNTEPPQLVILPGKAGRTRLLPRHNITGYSGARWFPLATESFSQEWRRDRIGVRTFRI